MIYFTINKNDSSICYVIIIHFSLFESKILFMMIFIRYTCLDCIYDMRIRQTCGILNEVFEFNSLLIR